MIESFQGENLYKINKKFNYITDMKVDTLSTGRTYHTPSGSYASITTILGQTANNLWLQRWKDTVGEEEAARISKQATDRGELIHSYAEKHFNNEKIDYSNEEPVIRQMTKDLISATHSGIDEVWGQEQILWSNRYKYAGRTDMVGLWKGVPSIIDFKTSRKIKYDNQIRDYYIQCCAYAIAHNELYNTGIKQGVIVMTIENKPPKIFIKNLPPFLYELKNRVSTFYK